MITMATAIVMNMPTTMVTATSMPTAMIMAMSAAMNMPMTIATVTAMPEAITTAASMILNISYADTFLCRQRYRRMSWQYTV